MATMIRKSQKEGKGRSSHRSEAHSRSLTERPALNLEKKCVKEGGKKKNQFGDRGTEEYLSQVVHDYRKKRGGSGKR